MQQAQSTVPQMTCHLKAPPASRTAAGFQTQQFKCNFYAIVVSSSEIICADASLQLWAGSNSHAATIEAMNRK
jgi:hypothetical protein